MSRFLQQKEDISLSKEKCWETKSQRISLTER